MRKGAETWIAGTFDPDLNTTYWGVAQAKPWRRDLRGSAAGDTNYANSTIALDPDTGKLKWFFQHGPGESLDLDEVYERVLINHGEQKTLMTIGKAGILWKLDRVTGQFIAAKETVFQNIWTGIDKNGRPKYRKDIEDQKVDQWLSSCPGPEGGHDWQATSYHQPSDTLIIPLSQSCVFMLGNGSQAYFEMPGTDGNMGRLSAYRTNDMKPLWSFQQRAPFLTGVISTAGNLAFVGDFGPRLPRGGHQQRQDAVEDQVGHHRAGLPRQLQRRRQTVCRRHHGPGRRQSGGQAQHHADRSPPPAQRLQPVRLRLAGRQVEAEAGLPGKRYPKRLYMRDFLRSPPAA